MSSYLFTEEELLFRDTIRQFVNEEVRPRAAEIDRTHEFPVDLWNRCVELGLSGLNVPEQYGGLEVPMSTELMIMEEFGRACPTLGLILDVHMFCCSEILGLGTEEQKAEWLPKLASGEVLGGVSRLQAEGSANAPDYAIGAVRDGDDYIINVTKVFQTNSVHSGVLSMLVRTDEGEFITIIVDKEANKENIEMGHIERKIGVNGSDTGTLVFHDVRVPVSNRMISRPSHRYSGIPNLDVATICLGAAEEAVDRTKEYLANRMRVGRPLATINDMGGILVTLQTQVDMYSSFVYYIAKAFDENVDGAAALLGREAKVVICEEAVKIISRCIELHGAVGTCEDTGLTRLMRDCQTLCIAEGSTHMLRAMLGLQMGIPMEFT